MVATRNGGGGFDEGTSRASQNSGRINRYHRHTAQQIQRLEGIFNECDHPDAEFRLQLSRELGLSPLQIKFWFQNKRTQSKIKQEKQDTAALRAENDVIRYENNVMREALKTMMCTSCGKPVQVGEDIHINQQKLYVENAHLKEEMQRLSRDVEKYTGMSVSQLNLGNSLQLPTLPSDGPSHDLLSNNSSTIQMLPFGIIITDMDRSFMVDLAHNAMDELSILLQSSELWMNLSYDIRTVINLEAYERRFSRATNSPKMRTESSKKSDIVLMNSLALVDFFMDANKCMEIFPTIVSKARTIEVIKAGLMGSYNNQLQLMYEELNVLSPLVQTRKFYILRFCKQIEQKKWAIVDITYDIYQELSDSGSRVRRLPSGCYIEDMLNGQSQITWMEHAQIEDQKSIHEFYREHIHSGLAFGAERRLATLQRMCERITYQMSSTTLFFYLGGVNTSPQEKINLMKLSQRMISSFCSSINQVDDQHMVWEMNDFEVHTNLRNCTNQGHYNNRILSAATTIWLPFAPQKIFDFLKDEKSRPQWDVMSDYDSVQEVGRISCGFHPGNCISIFEAFSTDQNKLILQESWIDPSGALVVYCPVLLHVINKVMSGEDASIFSLSPSGFVISGGMSSGALITVMLQIYEDNATSGNISQESVNVLNNFVRITIDKLKAALS